jgi:hypothetical protein
VRRLESVGLVVLGVAPLAFVATLIAARTGRDFTALFLFGLASFGVIGACLIGFGVWTGREDRVAAGMVMVPQLLFAVVFVCGNASVHWSGFTEPTLTVQVRDARTRQPIEGATVRFTSQWPEGDGFEAPTGPGGAAYLRCRFKSGGADSLIRRTGGLSVSGNLVVEAKGYRPVREPLWKYIGEGWDLYGPPLPVVEVNLERIMP